MEEKEIKIHEVSERNLTAEINDVNNFISELKAVGATPLDTMKILSKKLDINFIEAKDLTFASPSWKYLIGDSNPFVEEFLEMAAEDADEVEIEDGKVISVTYKLNKEEE